MSSERADKAGVIQARVKAHIHAPSPKGRGGESHHRRRRKVSPKRPEGQRHSKSPRQEQNPIWRKLQQISHSPFSAKIERAKFPARFVTPPLAVYDGKSDPVGHLSRFRQSMAIHNNNDALHVSPRVLFAHGRRCPRFSPQDSSRTPGSLRRSTLCWPFTMKAGETLKSYSTRYWEVYNDIDACDEDIVVKTFRFGLHEDSKLRKSFTKRPPLSMAELMTRLEEHIRVEDDPKSRAKTAEVAPLVDRKAAQPEPRGESRRARKTKGSAGTSGPGVCLAVYTTFKEPIYRLLPLIKDKPYFEWPPKLPGDPAARETKPYCNYHRERGHLTENCRAYRYHLEHLVKNGHLKQYVDETKSPHQNVEVPRINVKASAPIGIIDVIHFGTTCHDQRGEMRRAAHLREVFQVQDSPQMAPTPLRKESVEEIVFNNQDLEGVQLPHSDALVITLRIGEFDVKRVLIDPGSSVEIMYESLFKGLGLGKEDLSRTEGPLSGFSGETVIPSGKVTINVRAGTVSSPTEFFVLNTFSPYNAILGRPWLHRMGAVPSTLHQRLRFPTPQGIMEIRGDQLAAKQCLVAAVKQRDQLPQGAKEGPMMAEGGPQRQFLIGASLTQEHKSQLLTLLNKYQDVFAWTPYEAPGVDPEFVCHELNVSPEYKPVVQKARRTAPQHAEAVREEVERLLKIGAIREVLYPQWLSNTVVVKKKNGKWRVCVDFTDLNKACPKDPFPLPKIDQLVDSTAGHERMSFLDAFQGYHLDSPEEGRSGKNRVYHAPRGFLLQELLGRTVEVYIDDMVVKSIKGKDHIEDLERVFGILRRHNLKLNASKCAFGYQIKPSARQSYGDDSGDQRPVYYTSKTMNGAETRYLPLEKSALALFVTAKKLPHYFQAHTMIVLTSLPLKALFRSSDFSGRISKWGAQLGVYDVRYQPRTAIKGQVLADFIAEFAPGGSILTEEEHRKDTERDLEKKGWVLYVDGAANSRGSGLGIVLISPEGELLEQAVRLGFSASNNEAEYEALLYGLRAAKRLGADPLTIHCDSQLIVNQLTGEYMAKDERMIAYLDLARNLLKGFCKYNIERVGREHNGHADSLAGLASSVAPEFRRTIIVEVQDTPSIAKGGQAGVCQVEMGPSWMDPILGYLSNDILPADQKEAAKIRKTATRSTREYAVAILEGDRWLTGRSGRAIGGPICRKMRLNMSNAARSASYSPQPYTSRHHSFNPISSPWPFAQWGLDLVGPLPRATGNRQWLIVATDYFTKWVEAEPLARITDSESRKFVWKNIITRFGIPRCFVSDNGTQFDSGPFKKYCSDFGIRNHFSSPAYPQGNGQAESSNKVILSGIKKKLEEAKGRWVEELPTVLWTFRTTPRSSTGETPYSLTYGVEAVIPLEVGLPTLRSEEYDQDNNELVLAKDLDLAQERRDLAMIRLASYQGDLKKRYGKSVRERILAPGDLVLRKVLGSKRDPTQGKLGANWEGPYQIMSEAGLGAFNLQGMDGKPLKRPWNISNLKKFYQ
uniref:RNA-directed DNA polymerase n=1 Tax=Fagus sylvatica TaxID=28930 RepID=A0A2N9GJI0_FAGSY